MFIKFIPREEYKISHSKEIAEHTNSPVEQLFRDFANEKGTMRVGVGKMIIVQAHSHIPCP